MPYKERTIVDWREEMALRALDKRYTVSEVARAFGVSRPTVRLWRERYREQGRGAMLDRSHAPESCPHRTGEQVEALIVAERKRWGWGSRKILKRLEESHPELVLPARSTADAILARHGLIERRRGGRSAGRSPFVRRYEASEPGELTTIDHKGEFRLGSGRYCYPLTMVDSVSRYVLACEALDSTSFQRAWPVIERVFREHGLPVAMQSDNGPPFGATNGRFSQLSVALMALGVQPIFGRPGVPQDNARHERMHRELKRRATRPLPRASPNSRSGSPLSSLSTTASDRTKASVINGRHASIPVRRVPIRADSPSPITRCTTSRGWSTPAATSSSATNRSSSAAPWPDVSWASNLPTRPSGACTSTASSSARSMNEKPHSDELMEMWKSSPSSTRFSTFPQLLPQSKEWKGSSRTSLERNNLGVQCCEIAPRSCGLRAETSNSEDPKKTEKEPRNPPVIAGTEEAHTIITGEAAPSL
jgi:transposase InsO family protein